MGGAETDAGGVRGADVAHSARCGWGAAEPHCTAPVGLGATPPGRLDGSVRGLDFDELWSREARHASTSSSPNQEFENGAPALFFQRLLQFSEILRVDVQAIVTAFVLRKPNLAHVFAQNKLMLVQASAVDELDEDTREAIAAVDPLTVLDAHMQFYQQLAELGRAQLRAAAGRRDRRG